MSDNFKINVLIDKLEAALEIIINPHEFNRGEVLSWADEVSKGLKEIKENL